MPRGIVVSDWALERRFALEGDSMRTRLLCAAFSLLMTVVFCSPSAFPQATISFAQLNGTVLDTGGRSVAKANISARQVDTNQTYTTTTTDAGFYVLPSLP